MKQNLSTPTRVLLLGTLLLLGTQALVLFLYGQPWLCGCGEVKFWEGVVASSGNSQQVSDWYTFSHVIHGFIFYLLLWKLFPRMSLVWRLLLAMGIEISWELLENTPMVIAHYRSQALAVGYSGDSILNSVCDTLSMLFGFVLARKFPVIATVALVIGLELYVGYMIHDNLTLNVINLIYPFEFIARWQMS